VVLLRFFFFSVQRNKSLFFSLLFFCFCLLFLLSLSLFRPPRPSIFSFSFLSCFCLSDLLSLFIVPCFLLSILFCFSPLFFDYFSLLPGSLFLILSKCSPFCLPVSFFFKIFLSQQNSLLCSPFCSSLYLLPKCSPPLFVFVFLVSLLSNLYFFSFSRPQILYSFVPSFLSCPLIFFSVCLLYLKSLYILH
jgi:hypothetical protein